MVTLVPPARTRKPRGQGASRRGEILAAAKKLFLQRGVEHATMRRIAEAVGVSSTALYVYFPDKEAILDAISESMFEALIVAYAQSQTGEQPPLARFRAGLQAYVAFGLAHPDEYRLTFGASTLSRCHEIEAAETGFEMLRQHVEVMMRADIFATDDTMKVAEALWACMHGVVMLLLNQPEHVATPRQTLIDAVIDAAIKGFRA